jgi:hypothetical protein
MASCNRPRFFAAACGEMMHPSSEVLKKIVTEDLTPSAGLRSCAYTQVTFGLTPGTRLGVDDINAQIGVGGTGEVYRATDSNLKRSLAIEVLPASVIGDADRVARFQRSGGPRGLQPSEHRSVYALEKTRDLTVLLMGLVEGEDRRKASRPAPFRSMKSLPIVKQIAPRLEAAAVASQCEGLPSGSRGSALVS